ncbi:hypothetical protein AB0C34_04765 [Nocardia sp. NPDC049220]|uniref:hypothetical protein n=1 Tax=Nocardia sp. NPDC049220 TaxID=3155273 RepID=UPI0033C53D1E
MLGGLLPLAGGHLLLRGDAEDVVAAPRGLAQLSILVDAARAAEIMVRVRTAPPCRARSTRPDTASPRRL